MRSFVFTSESVSEGHPDKVCDQISDAILDAHFAGDTASRVACETMVKNGVVALAGEITSNQEVDYTQVVRQAIKDIGYTDPSLGFDNDTCEILIFINQQSSDISMGVNEGEGTFTEQGAGDQGLMFGFACNETPELMPMPIALSHKLVHKLADVRKADSDSFLRPDSKSQVTIKYENGKPTHVDTIVISTQHTEEATNEQIEELVREQVVKQVIPENLLSKDTRYFINPTGRFVIGGPVGDAGLTGRKIIVDTYGGYGRHGGGAFSGKDPSKVDRSAAYIARYLAKNVVAANLADRCEVQLAYAIGVAQPVSVFVETFGTAKADEEKIGEALTKFCDLTPSGIIKELNLLNPNKIYQQTAAYGHFGRDFNSETGAFSWENTSRAKELADLV